jgi:hypothetical protein
MYILMVRTHIRYVLYGERCDLDNGNDTVGRLAVIAVLAIPLRRSSFE